VRQGKIFLFRNVLTPIFVISEAVRVNREIWRQGLLCGRRKLKLLPTLLRIVFRASDPSYQHKRSMPHCLLQSVLQNGDEKLIGATVRRLPVSCIVPLVKELAQRMHGHAQSGRTLVRWLKAVLSVHTSYLVTVRFALCHCSISDLALLANSALLYSSS